MAASLQSRVQLLAILAVAFTLVSVPLFYQVRADAAESRETAKSTFLSKLFRDIARDLKQKPPEDLQVEDAWEKWQDENPDCGAACDPEADPDGDGVSNRDEVEQGRNPLCNEEKEGTEYCAGQPKGPPPVNETKALDDILYDDSLGAQGQDSFDVDLVVPDYDRWVVSWSLTGYQGFGSYDLLIQDEDGNVVWRTSNNVDILTGQDSGSETLDGEEMPASGANYTIRVQSEAFQGDWAILIRGLRDAPQT